MERMGHSTITVTLGNYGHLFPKLDEALDDARDGMIRQSQPSGRASVERFASGTARLLTSPCVSGRGDGAAVWRPHRFGLSYSIT